MLDRYKGHSLIPDSSMIKAKKPKGLHKIEAITENKTLMDTYLEGRMMSIEDMELEIYNDIQKCKECLKLNSPQKLKKNLKSKEAHHVMNSISVHS